MPKPIGDLLINLGPEVHPFERSNRNSNPGNPPRVPLDGETDSFDEKVINVINIESLKIISTTRKNLNFDTRYLWIIDKRGLFLILENTENLKAARKVVCHSNITKGKKALQGGELWFLDKKNIIINFKSGRYGAENEIQENAVIEYFQSLGFVVEVE